MGTTELYRIIESKDRKINYLNKQNKDLIIKNKELQEQLTSIEVSWQRELLIAFLEKLENTQDETIPINTYEEIADKYLNHNL